MTVREAFPLEDIIFTTIDGGTEIDGAWVCPLGEDFGAEASAIYADVSCKCSCATGIPTVGSVSIEAESEFPVRFVNGELRHSQMDLGAGGYGHGWGHTRIYANQLSFAADIGQGPYWLVKEWPYLLQKADGTIVYQRGVHEAIWFPESGGNYTASYGVKATLTHDSGNDIFKLVMPDGEIFLFHDFDQTSVPKGAFKSHTTVGGQVTSVISFTDGRIEEIQRSVTIDSDTTIESFFYEYDGNNQLQYVTLRRKVNAGSWSNVRRAEYTYYGASADYGGEGDLQTAERQLHDGMSWVTTDTTYYRYYQDGDANGFAHAIKFIIGPEAYRRLDDAVANPLTATDAQVDDYADHYFEYDESKRVTKEITRGGTHTTLFSYKYSGNAAGANNWHYKTVETADGGETITVYTNHLGQVLLRELKDGSDSWVNYVQYNSAYLPVLHAHPSAVTSYDDAEADLGLSLKASAGHIDVTTYYSTTAGSGVKDYPEYEKVKKGSTGSEVKLRKYEYTSRTANSITVYPVSKTIVYRNDDGTGDIETSFSYSWHTSSLQMQERVTTLPVISTAQHGSNSANSRTERFDEHGNLIWMKDERGYITRHVYDAVRGVMTQMIQDVDHTQVSDEPSGWTTPAGGGLHLVSDFEYDDLGRQTQSLGPAHEIDISGSATSIRRASWTVYDDENHEVCSASGYGSGGGYSTYTLINPVSISKLDQAGRTTEQIQATRASTSGKLVAADTFAQSVYVRWSTMSYDDQGNMQWSRVYHDIPSSGAGSSGTNYNQSDFAYSDGGERIMAKTPGGTITRTVFDVRGNAVAVYVGTDDTGATESDPTNGGAGGNNMKLVAENEFDGGADGGDNDLTEVTQHVDASNTRVTSYLYDFRGRQTDIDGEIDFYQINTYDNLGNVTRVDRKNTSSGGTLIARSETKFDDLGRVYQSLRYAVNPSTGSVGNALTDKTWYDASGNVIKSQPAGSQAFSKTQYDGLGRAVKSFVGFDTDETTYAEADDVTGDTLFEQNESEFDASGNVIRTIHRRRFHDATGTGELTSPSGSQPKARVSYVAMYPDALGRSQAIANYGTNGGSAHTRATTIPTRSDDILVSETFYDSAGNAWKTVDPAGREMHTTFDDLGRTLSTIENYDDGDPTSGNADVDRTIAYTYNEDGQVATITAKHSSGANDQLTRYVYGATLSESDIARADLLRAVIYADSDDAHSPLGDGTDTTYDRVEYKYNRLGQRKEMKDQNATVHVYERDALGRQTHDRVTTVGSGIDNAVLRISRTYEVRGLLENVISYDNAVVGSGSVVNEIEYEYNDFGQPEKEYQSHSGAVNTGSSPKVQYTYADGSSNHVRLTKITYPNGRILRYEYSSGDDELSRPSYLADDSSGSVGTHLAEYSYLGASHIVQVDYTEPDLRCDLAHGGGSDPYDGPLDRFDRVTDLLWRDYGASEDAERVKHGYDRLGNRLWRENPVAAAQMTPVHQDELYAYDGLNRLASLDRGDLNGTQDGLVSMTKTFGEAWSLDAVENWTNFKQDTDGDGNWDLNQDRTHNKANEIATIASSSSHVAYDRAGNMTRTPKPDNWSSHFDLTFDAWNRLVLVEDGDTTYTVAVYAYDGTNRRTLKDIYVSDSLDHTRHFYYSNRWQILEERIDSATLPERQHVWGLRYIDDLILRDRDDDDDPETGDLGIADSGLEERLYAMQDPNWNVTAIADASGGIQERVRSSAYGNVTELNEEFVQSNSTSSWTVGYAGYCIDPETSFHHVRLRYASGYLGRWLTKDPELFVDGLNYFAYAQSQPHVLTDPSGLHTVGSPMPSGTSRCGELTPQAIEELKRLWMIQYGWSESSQAEFYRRIREVKPSDSCRDPGYYQDDASRARLIEAVSPEWHCCTLRGDDGAYFSMTIGCVKGKSSHECCRSQGLPIWFARKGRCIVHKGPIARTMCESRTLDQMDFLTCLHCCMQATEFVGERSLGAVNLMVGGQWFKRVVQPGQRTFKSIWTMKRVRDFCGLTIKQGQILGRVGIVGTLVQGAYEWTRISYCTHRCS